MRMLAEFIMRGPLHAIAVSALGVLVGIPLISQIAMGLVTLRNGGSSGVMALIAAVAPLLILVSVDDGGFVTALFVSGLLVTTLGLALILRATVSWPLTLVAAVLLSAIVATLLVLGQPRILVDLTELFAMLSESFQQQGRDASNVLLFDAGSVSSVMAIGLIALAINWFSVLGLLLGRWFQALLYNPGGFQTEFHQIRLNRPIALICVLVAFLCQFSGEQYIFLANLAVFPLEIVGLSLVHFFAKRFDSGTPILIGFYLMMVLLTPLMLFVLMVLGFTDVWFNYREKMKSSPQ